MDRIVHCGAYDVDREEDENKDHWRDPGMS